MDSIEKLVEASSKHIRIALICANESHRYQQAFTQLNEAGSRAVEKATSDALEWAKSVQTMLEDA